MLTWVAVGLGGALGPMARHAVNRLVLHHWPSLRFPVATLIVNFVGCCVFGLPAGWIASGLYAALRFAEHLGRPIQ